MTPAPKLHALTSLRFFAALVIVAHHVKGSLGVPADLTFGQRFTLNVGVSFFFVLSGFVLTYAYPRFDTAAATGRFLFARFARVWPAHVLALGVWMAVAATTPADVVAAGRSLPFLANIAMVHAWVPFDAYTSSYGVGNGVSWSISTEFGFYVLFPLLVWRLERTWPLKLGGALLLAVGLILLCDAWALPRQGNDLTADALLYKSPLGRLFEFVLGMTAAHAWRSLRPRVRVGLAGGTAVEAAALALAAVSVYYSGPLARWILAETGLYRFAGIWLLSGGIVGPSFAVFIVVMALDAGVVSRLLSRPALVLLGEVSYSLYLLHLLILGYVLLHADALAWVPDLWQLAAYLVVALAAAHLAWVLVEMPARRWLLGWWPTPRPAAVPPLADPVVPRRPVYASLRPTWTKLLVAAELAAVGLLVYVCEGGRLGAVEDAVVASTAARPGAAARGVRFGDRYELRGAWLDATARGWELTTVWAALRDHDGPTYVAVHLCDDTGAVLGDASYPRAEVRRRVNAGEVWVERRTIPAKAIETAGTPSRVAIGVGDTAPPGAPAPPLMRPDGGPRDPGGWRLLVPAPPL